MADEFDGQGGSYVVNKKGKRELKERTAPPQTPIEPETPAENEQGDK
jgi:hypothetical protein